MGNKTAIEWTDASWNPIRGCSRVSEGCRHCYAETVANRFCGPGKPYEGVVRIGADGKGTGQWNGEIKFLEERLLDPLRWKTAKRIFVNSMSDLFHENVTDEMLDRIFAVMALCPQHTFQVLTKRPERMLAYLTELSNGHRRVSIRGAEILTGEKDSDSRAFCEAHYRMLAPGMMDRWSPGPLPNVWLGVSVESPKHKDRIDILRQTPAALRMLSLEPLLEDLGVLNLDGIGWVIVGGESGPGARPVHPDWARRLRDQSAAAGVPFFFKQWGEWGIAGRERHLFGPADSGKLLCFTTVCSTDRKERGEQTFAALPPIPGDLTLVSPTGGWIEFERMRRVGKKAAGHLLDSEVIQQFPEVRVV